MELKSIDRTDRGRSRLNAALSIYRETILPEAQNPERQILYWIDHYKDELADEFRCFAIQSDNKIVGYLQYSYFREEHVFFSILPQSIIVCIILHSWSTYEELK